MSLAPLAAPASPLVRRLGIAGVFASALLVGATLPAVASTADVNPTKRGVVVRTTLEQPAVVQLEVKNARGTVIALTPPKALGAGARGLRWNGRRGPSSAGARVPDGVYRMRLLPEEGSPISVDPIVIRVDSRKPKVTARVATRNLTLPPSTPKLSATVRDATKAAQVRVLATPVRGRALRGAWSRSVSTPRLPKAMASGRRTGVFVVRVEARDAAGNIGTSRPVTLRVPPPPGPARVVRRASTRKPWVTLAFDDGLHPSAMSSIISTLRNYDMGATFCLNGVYSGRWGSALRAQMALAVADGVIDLCSHGYSHRTGTGTGLSEARSDLGRNVIVDRAVGTSSTPFYRPPFGRLSPGLQTAAGELGYRTILMWDIDPSDYLASSSGAVTSHVVSRARRGSIVVLHAQPLTAAALPGMLRGLRAKGLRAVPAGQLLGT